MNIEERVELISRRPVVEVVTEQELRELLSNTSDPVAYNGFEPSGPMHIGTGLVVALKVKDFAEAGVKFKLLLATWHAKLNGKLGGDMDKIHEVAEYFIEGWKAFGLDSAKVDFIFAEDLISQTEYWELLLKISERITHSSVVRALPIMGRTQTETLRFGSYIYPLMQVTDIFMLGARITQLGMDQRKANMLAREVGSALGKFTPVAAHHHLLAGLQGPAKMGYDENPVIDTQISSKMSKSRPETAIWVHDTEEDIRRKIRGAFCPERQLDPNPVMEYARYLILRRNDDLLEINRPAHKGGPISVSLPELEALYSQGAIHPLDLKDAVSDRVVAMLEPARKALAHRFEKIRAYIEKPGQLK